jgi:predicted ATP-grasp superfamily ATP-dependent carboligase
VSVFVTDGEQRATLALVRALGRAGIPVTVGSKSAASLAGSSRYCAQHVQYPSPTEQNEAFQTFLLNEMKSGGYSVLFPMTDITTILAAGMRNALDPFVRVPIATSEQIACVQDKREMLLAAQKVGIGAPATYMLRDDEDIDAVAERIQYPVVLKPRLSWLYRNEAWMSGGVQFIHSAAELKDKYRAAHALIPNPLVQERLEGEGRGVFLLIWNGELKAAFCHRRLREKPPWGGVSVYRESMPLDREIVEKSYRLLQQCGWQGPAMVEFKVDNRDGQLKLMEVNGRFWGSLQLALDAGMNFPLLYYRLAIGENAPAQFDYKPGVRSRWLLGDLDQLLIRWTHPAGKNGMSGPQPSKLRASLDFMKFYEPDLHYEIFRFEDPAPGWFEAKVYVRALAHLPERKAELKEKSRAH